METCYLTLWFAGPLQSWGVDSKFYRRVTQDFPSKSGVLGMLFSVMGLAGEQRELLSEFDGLDMRVWAYKQSEEPLMHMQDFQVLGAAYNDEDEWETLFVPRRGNGFKPAYATGSKLIYKDYLTDVFYGIVLEIPLSIAELVVEGFSSPVFGLSLGRKCCIPSEPVYRGIYAAIDLASSSLIDIAMDRNLKQLFVVLQGSVEGACVMTVNDQPVCFGACKEYKSRVISVV